LVSGGLPCPQQPAAAHSAADFSCDLSVRLHLNLCGSLPHGTARPRTGAHARPSRALGVHALHFYSQHSAPTPQSVIALAPTLAHERAERKHADPTMSAHTSLAAATRCLAAAPPRWHSLVRSCRRRRPSEGAADGEALGACESDVHGASHR
jgi:hypothetical protein